LKRQKKIILATGLGIVLLFGNYFGVQYFINKGIDPVEVVYSSKEIPPGTKITEDMLQTRTVPRTALPPNALLKKEDIVGKYAAHGYGISKNSLFYKENVLTEDEMPNSSVLKLEKGEVAFPLLVDLETSLGNSILPDQKVDLAFRGEVEIAEEKNGIREVRKKPIYGIIAKNVRVTSVKDTEASNVFSENEKENENNNVLNKDDKKRPLAKIYTFAVNEEINELLNKASLLGEIRPVAKGEATGEMTLSQDEIIAWIEENSYTLKAERSSE
jgi:pilus assembly protein CpaB